MIITLVELLCAEGAGGSVSPIFIARSRYCPSTAPAPFIRLLSQQSAGMFHLPSLVARGQGEVKRVQQTAAWASIRQQG